MGTIASQPIGTEALASTVVRDAPTVAITAPDSVVLTTTVQAQWSYSSTLGRPQVRYRVRLYTPVTNHYDSGWIDGAATSFTIPYLLQGHSLYTVEVQASDGIDTGTASKQIYVELGDPLDSPINADVGSLYEVAINGVGLMLADTPNDPQTRYRRQTIQLDPDRLATGSTPFSEAIERYNYIAWENFRGGSGQRFTDRSDSDPTRFFYSEGVDPFTRKGEVRLVHDKEIVVASGEDPCIMTAIGPTAFVKTDADELTSWNFVVGTPTSFTATTNGDEIVALASDGQVWYAATPGGIYANYTSATGSVWATETDIAEMCWTGDRLMGVDPTVNAPAVYAWASDGSTEDGGPKFTYTQGSIKGICGGSGYAYWGHNVGVTGTVRAWQLGSQDGDFVALNMPEGETITYLYHYLGNIFVATTGPGGTRLYRCVSNEGRLLPELVAGGYGTELGGPVTSIAGAGNLVAFTWTGMTRDDRGGYGVLDLETAGVVRWWGFPDPASVPRTVVPFGYGSLFMVTQDGEGLWAPNGVGYVAEGFLETSVSDLATNVAKVFEEVSLTTAPMRGVVEVAYSLNSNDSFRDLGVLDAAGAGSTTLPIGAQGQSIGVRLTLRPTQDLSDTPAVKRVSVKVTPLGLTDQLLSMAVSAENERRGLNGNALPDNGPTRGRDIARYLESLVGRLVKLQDIDWPISRTPLTYQVVQADYMPVGMYSPQLNRRVDGGYINVVLRRPQ